MNRVIHGTVTVGPGVSLGWNVILLQGVELGEGVTIGHHTIIYPGTRIGARTVIGDHCVIGRRPVTSPASPRHAKQLPPLEIGTGCVIGASCVLVAGSRIGDGVFIGDLASIDERCQVSDHVSIGPRVMVEPESFIGEATEIQAGSHIAGTTVIEDHVLLGAQVTTVNDNRMARGGGQRGPRIRSGVRIGANATILGGLTVGEDAVVGAGAVVLRDVPNYMVAVGVPARVVKDVGAEQLPTSPGLAITIGAQ
ncbi:MAG: N-acetyltransferase [Candidatus Rokubacteria bacterium]|nr:N-acetyltransferase [Candidatus Rokubacteria bacterium]